MRSFQSRSETDLAFGNRTFDAQPSGQLLIVGFDLVSSQGSDRTTHFCVGRGPGAHLTWTFAGSVLVLHGLAEPSGWPSAGCLEVNKCTVFCRNIKRVAPHLTVVTNTSA